MNELGSSSEEWLINERLEPVNKRVYIKKLYSFKLQKNREEKKK